MNVSELFFCPSSKRWLLRIADDYWKIGSRGEALTLASVLPLQILASPEVFREKPARGTAAVVAETNAGCTLHFIDQSGGPDRPQLQLAPSTVGRGLMQWLDGYCQDRWLSCDARLAVEGARRIGVRVYLPPVAGQTVKSVRALLDGNTIHEFQAVRSQVTEVWLDLGEVDDAPHTLDLISGCSEISAPGGDARSLGFLLVSLNVDNTRWVPPETFQ